MDSPRSLQGTCVLLVDDDEHTIKLVSALLREAHCHVHAARSGLDALRLLLSGLEVFALLVELELPDVSGLALVSFLKACAGSRQLRMLALSSTPGARTVAEAFAAGCDGLVSKPIEAEALVRTLATWQR